MQSHRLRDEHSRLNILEMEDTNGKPDAVFVTMGLFHMVREEEDTTLFELKLEA
jgi:hypothetical protein